MKKIIVLLIFFLIELNCLAASPFDLNDCVEYALLNNKQIKNLKLELENTKLKIKEEKKALYPQLGFNALYSKYKDPYLLLDEDLKNFLPSGYKVKSEDLYSWEFKISQLIYSFGKVESAIDIAQLFKDINNLILQKEQLNLKQNIEKTFYTILFLKKNNEVLKSILKQRKESTQLIKDYVDEGIKLKVDYLKALSEQKTIEYSIITNENEINSLLRTLKFLIGMDINDTIEITGNLISEIPEDFNEEILINKAIENRPSLQYLKTLIEIKNREIQLNKSLLKPTISFIGAGGVSSSKSSDIFDKDLKKWNLALNIDFPFYDSGKTKLKNLQNENEIKKINNQVSNLLDNISITIKNIINSMDALKKKLELTKVIVNASKEAQRISYDLYQNGVITQTELSQAENNFLTAKLRELEVYYNYKLLLSDLSRVAAENNFKIIH